MIAQILKARYYPRGSLSEAGIGYQPSYLWRSLLNTRPLIHEGLAWRVGDGKSISSFVDKWIGTKTLTCPYPHDNRPEDSSHVAFFIDKDNATWIEERVRRCFIEEDAISILSMPLSARMPPDKAIWKGTKDGKFSVKSAYHIATEKLSTCGIDLPSTSSPPKIWKKIWQLNIPPSTRHFMWRACRDLLPTNMNLRRRGIQVDPLCAGCGLEAESTSHVLIGCETAALIWKFSPIRLIDPEKHSSF